MAGSAHQRAGRLAQEAEIKQRLGEAAEAEGLYAEAADSEQAALDGTSKRKARTYSILAVSVVALRYKARQLDRAEIAAHYHLGSPSTRPWARTQLRDLLETVWDEQALERQGLKYSGEEITLSMRGGAIGTGTAPLGVATRVQEGSQALITRFAEANGQFPFRRRGLPPQQLTRQIEFRATVPGPGSYRFTIKIAEAAQVEMYERSPVDVSKLASDLMAFIRASSEGDSDRLRELLPVREYRLTALQLLRNLSPQRSSTAQYKELDFIRSHPDRSASIRITHESRSAITTAIKNEARPDSEETELRGVLRAVHLDKTWLEIVLESGERQRCKTPSEMLDDVVGPWVNHEVVVRGKWSQSGKKSEFHATDIDGVEE